jgi:hypothetical protein
LENSAETEFLEHKLDEDIYPTRADILRGWKIFYEAARLGMQL